MRQNVRGLRAPESAPGFRFDRPVTGAVCGSSASRFAPKAFDRRQGARCATGRDSRDNFADDQPGDGATTVETVTEPARKGRSSAGRPTSWIHSVTPSPLTSETMRSRTATERCVRVRVRPLRIAGILVRWSHYKTEARGCIESHPAGSSRCPLPRGIAGESPTEVRSRSSTSVTAR